MDFKYPRLLNVVKIDDANLGTRRSCHAKDSNFHKSLIARVTLPEIEILTKLEYQKFVNYVAIMYSECAKIVTQLVVVHFMSFCVCFSPNLLRSCNRHFF